LVGEEVGIMSPELILWKPYKLGEPPPVRFDCPLHIGELLPCRICVAWLRRTQAEG
jgi:hypothetical protein